MKGYAVLEDAGKSGEKEVTRFESFNKALEYMYGNYNSADIYDLTVDIVRIKENGEYSTEF